MIWTSTFIMTVIDLAIIFLAIACVGIWIRFRPYLVLSGGLWGAKILSFGFLLVGLFYLADLWTMYGLPIMVGKAVAMQTMEDLHLNYSWIVMLVGMSAIFTGFILTSRSLFTLLREFQHSESTLLSEINSRQETEKRLGQSEEVYRRVVEDQTEFLVRWKPDGTRTFVNRAYCLHFGQSGEQLIGTSFFPLISPEDRDKVYQRIQKITQAHPISTDEHRVINPDGSIGWQRWTDRGFFDEYGELVEFQSVGIDVTDLKLAQERLGKSEERFQLAVQGSTDGLWDWLDPTQDNAWFSPRFFELLGYEDGEIEASYSMFQTLLHPEDHQQTIEAIEAHLTNRIPFDVEYRLRKKSGEYGWFRARGQAQWDESGKPLRMAGSIQDIDDWKRSESDLQVLVEGTAFVGGESFFHALVRHLALALRVRYVFLTELLEGEPQTCRVISSWVGDRWGPPYTYQINHTPCLEVFQQGVAYYPERIQEQFPLDQELVELGAVGYMGVHLANEGGQAIGHLCILDDKPLTDELRVQALVRVFAGRAGAELTRQQIEGSLQKSEKKYRTLFEAASDGIVVVDQDGCFVDCNQQFFDMLEYSKDQLIGQTPWSTSPPTQPDGRDSEEKARSMLEAAFSGQPTRFEWVHTRGDGTPIDVEVSLNRIEVDQCPVVLCNARDIRDRKKMEHALHRSEKKYRTLFESASDGIVVYQDECFMDCNQQFLEILGCSKDQLIGQTPWSTSPATQRDGVGSEEKARSVLAEAFSGKTMMFEWVHTRGDGTLIDVEVSLNVIEVDQRRAVLCNVRDIRERKKMEHAIHRSEKKYRTLFEAANDGIVVFQDGCFVDCNQQYLEMLDYSRAQIIGNTPWAISPPTQPDGMNSEDKVRKILEAAFSGKPMMFEWVHTRGDGTTIDVEVSLNVIEVNQGSAVLAHLRDIRERKQAEEALRFTQFAIDHAGDGAVWIGQDGRILYANETTCRSLGYSQEELLTMRISDLDPDYPVEVWPATWEMIQTQGTAVFETRHRAKDGRIYPVEITVWSLEYGGQAFACAFARDITERKQTERALRDSEERFRQVTENITEVFWLTDPQKEKMLYVSPAYEEIWGRTRESLYRSPSTWVDAIHSDDQVRVLTNVLSKQMSGTYSVEYRVVRPDGSVHWIWDRAFPVRDENGEICRIAGIAEDITDRKRTEQALLNIARGVSAEQGERFFRSLVEHLAIALGVDYAFAGLVKGEKRDSIEIIALWGGGQILDNFEYDLFGTPCQDVIHQGLCTHPQDVQELFPQDVLLKEMGIEGYSGMPLFDSGGDSLGILVVLHRQSLSNIYHLESTIKIFATRAAAEFERNKAEMALRDAHRGLEKRVEERTTELSQSNSQLNQEIVERGLAQKKLAEALTEVEHGRDDLVSILDQLHSGTLMTDEEGQVTFVSESAQQFLQLTDKHAYGKPWIEVFPLTQEDKAGLQALVKQVSSLRHKLLARLTIQRDGRNPWLDIEIHDDPRSDKRKIFFLYDRSEVQDLRELLKQNLQFYDMVGQSKAISLVFQQVRQVAGVDSIVLIEGETGTGKELVARAIHQASRRKDRPFIVINCAGLTESLLGSQLFGHKRGSFTGAVSDQQGLFEAAEGGTLFLDEIGDIPLSVQTNLLRVLQEREITRIGDSKPRKINVRVLTATHQDLSAGVAQGHFRADLLYRIRVARIHIPPLRSRREDVPLLAASFLRQCQAITGKEPPNLSTQAIRYLLDYAWPGNVRELKSAIEFAVIQCEGTEIQPQDLPPEIANIPTIFTRDTANEPANERDHLLRALEQAKGNRAEAAKFLGISRATFFRRLSRHGLTKPS